MIVLNLQKLPITIGPFPHVSGVSFKESVYCKIPYLGLTVFHIPESIVHRFTETHNLLCFSIGIHQCCKPNPAITKFHALDVQMKLALPGFFIHIQDLSFSILSNLVIISYSVEKLLCIHLFFGWRFRFHHGK